jgi:4'-phosphopantetheinyl transferase EntD
MREVHGSITCQGGGALAVSSPIASMAHQKLGIDRVEDAVL